MTSRKVQTMQEYCDREGNGLSMQPFRFFDLPRELRDGVYRLLPLGPLVFRSLHTVIGGHLHPVTGGHSETSYRRPYILGKSHAWLEQPSRLNILLSSKQLSKEYLELQLRPSTTLVLRGIPAPSDSTLPTQVVDAVTLYLSAECKEETHPANDCVAVRIIREHTHCLKDVFPNLPEHGAMHIRLGLWWYSDVQCCWPKHIHSDGLIDVLDQLVRAVPTIKDLEIVLFATMYDYEAWSMRKFPGAENWATWSEKDCWQRGSAIGRPERNKNGRKKTLEEITKEWWEDVVGQTRDMDV